MLSIVKIFLPSKHIVHTICIVLSCVSLHCFEKESRTICNVLFYMCKIVYARLFSKRVSIFLCFNLSVLITMVDSKEVEIFFENGVVPLVLSVKDARVVVHDHTFSTKFKFLINSTLLKKVIVILHFMGEVAWAILQEPIHNVVRRQ